MASLLRAVGLPELITTSLPDYEALALRLAREPGRLDGFRQTLARNLDTCPLFDTDKFRRHIETAYAHDVGDLAARRGAACLCGGS